MENFQYKFRQEKILVKKIASSSFLTEEMLWEIKKFYNPNPYHNFLHALQVSSEVLFLSPRDFNVIEIKSLLFAALFHDAWHMGQANLLDEFRSLDIALNSLEKFEKKYDIWFLDKSLIRKAIVWTVFAKRWKLTDRFARILWDLDVWIIWWEFLEFCYFWFPFAFELGQSKEEYLEKTEIWYFKYLLSFSKNILLTREIREIMPNSLKNIKIYLKNLKENKEVLFEMMDVIKNEDISLEEFKEKFERKIKN